MKIRIKFSKEGNLRFVGHLGMMRCFQKANRCAELPAAYSEGFYPHRIMNFAAPLGMGLEGKAEYSDLHIMEEGAATLHSAEATERLNREIAEGIRTLSFLRLPDDLPNCMSIVHAVDYEILFRAVAPKDKVVGQFVNDSAYRSPIGGEGRSPRVAVDELLQHREVPVQKTGKEGNPREPNLRPIIHALRCGDNRLRRTVAQGSEANLKPELLLLALFPLDTARPPAAMPRRVARTELYDSAGKTLENYGTVL